LSGKQWKTTSDNRSEDSICCKDRCGTKIVRLAKLIVNKIKDLQRKVRVDEVIEALKEYAENAKTNKYSRCCGRHPVD